MSDRPSVTATEHELPFWQLSWEQFERLCLRLVYRRGYGRVEHIGRAGNDRGRDIIAWDGDVRVAVQCKRVRQFSAADGRREIDKLLALDARSRPQRLIFIATCSISSYARDEIRGAWGGDERACEFVAVAELDAEVRADPDLLQEFFFVAGDRARASQRHDLDELSRTESSNREWVAASRTLYFRRLLRAIAEEEHLAGRLEANRAFDSAVRTSGAATKPTAKNILRICEELEANELFQVNWTLRRMLARVVGDVIGLHLGREHARLVGNFCDARLNTPRGALLLAEAAVEHTAAASVIGAPILRGLLLSHNPQVPWQLLRRWPLISPVVQDGVDLEAILEVVNSSTKRMLLLTHLQRVDSVKALKRLVATVGEDIAAKSADSPDARLYDALVAWTKLNTGADLAADKSSRLVFRIDEVLYGATSTDHQNDALAEHLAQALELDSIERDLRNAGGAYQPDPAGRFSEGRYGYTRHYVRRALRAVPRDQVGTLLMRLARCADEGIRWGVAAELLNWWTLVADRDDAVNTALRLVDDVHPWVVREALQQLAADTLLCQAIGVTRVTRLAEGSNLRAEEGGWATRELAAAARRVAALAPMPRG